MATSQLNTVIQHFLTDLGPDRAGMTDGELWTRFLGSRDDNALAALMRRHSPMALGVCRRYYHHYAEDAFQPTFFVLVHNAVTVPRQGGRQLALRCVPADGGAAGSAGGETRAAGDPGSENARTDCGRSP
jgi:hypothetical protein